MLKVLKPGPFAAQKIPDSCANAYVTLISNTISNDFSEPDDREKLCEQLLSKPFGPLAAALTTQRLLPVLQACVTGGVLPRAVLKLKGVQQLPAAAVGHLLLQSVQQEKSGSSFYMGYMQEDLLRLPSALMVTPAVMEQVLVHALACGSLANDANSMRNFGAILRHPSACKLSTQGAQTVLLAALRKQGLGIASMLCQRLRRCAVAWRQLQAAELRDFFLQGAQPGTPESGAQRCPQLNTSVILAILQHPSMQDDSQACADVLTILLPKLTCQPHKLQEAEQQQLEYLLQVPAAALLGKAVLHELLQFVVPKQGCTLLPQLVKLPAAAQVSTGAWLELLQQLTPGDGRQVAPFAGLPAQQPRSSPRGKAAGAAVLAGAAGAATAAAAASEPSASHQAQQVDPAASSAALGDLLVSLVTRGVCATELLSLVLLPWAKGLSSKHISALLPAAVELQHKAAFDRLLQLPAAAACADAAEWGAYRSVMQYCRTDGLSSSSTEARPAARRGYGTFGAFQEGMFDFESDSQDDEMQYTDDMPSDLLQPMYENGYEDEGEDDDENENEDGNEEDGEVDVGAQPWDHKKIFAGAVRWLTRTGSR